MSKTIIVDGIKYDVSEVMEWKRCYDVVVPALQVKLTDKLGEIRELKNLLSEEKTTQEETKKRTP